MALAFGPHNFAVTVSATVGGWPYGSTVCFTPMLFPEVLNAKQGNSMYHFSSLWCDSTGHRTPTYRVQSEHSTFGHGLGVYHLNCSQSPSILLENHVFFFNLLSLIFRDPANFHVSKLSVDLADFPIQEW